MKKIFFLSLLFLGSLVACNQPTTDNNEKTDDSTTHTEKEPEKKGKIVKAKFIEFQLGDASHYIFEDEAGNDLDFGRNEDKQYEFSRELPESEANEENQGWGSRKELQGKWFEIRYETKQLPLYQDGPTGDVDIILEAKLLQ